jgi:hypothetical protein
MELDVLRYNSRSDYTDGLFFIDKDFECFTIEDEERTIKIKGETRIPDGRYKVVLRKEGGFNRRYGDKFGDFHKGMLWVKDVPGFEYILIHIGNDDDDTAGCLLLGKSADSEKGFIGGSTSAYKKAYKKIVDKLLDGEDVFINYKTIG